VDYAYVVRIPDLDQLDGLAFVIGLASGVKYGFLIGVGMTTAANLMGAGTWSFLTPLYTGIFGVVGGLVGRFTKEPNTRFMALSAIALTLLKEPLQELWSTLLFGNPFSAVIRIDEQFTAALIQNLIFPTTVGTSLTRYLRPKR